MTVLLLAALFGGAVWAGVACSPEAWAGWRDKLADAFRRLRIGFGRAPSSVNGEDDEAERDRRSGNDRNGKERDAGNDRIGKERHAGNDRSDGSYDDIEVAASRQAMAAAAAAAVAFAVAYLFYHHILAGFAVACTGLMYPRLWRRQLVRKRKEELRLQFKHALYALSSALTAGKSVENAFAEAAADLAMLYPDSRTDMIRELERINRLAENGVPLEPALLDFGRRSGIEDIIRFAETFAACKRTGGDLVEVMRRTSAMLGEKMDIEQDIAVLLSRKRLEARALGIIPLILVAFLAFSSSDYMAPLYEGSGRLVMTAALVVLAASQWAAWRMMNIRM